MLTVTRMQGTQLRNEQSSEGMPRPPPCYNAERNTHYLLVKFFLLSCLRGQRNILLLGRCVVDPATPSSDSVVGGLVHVPFPWFNKACVT